MVRKVFCTLLMAIFGLFFTQAQTRSTVETKVILVVHIESNQITNIELFKPQITENEMLKKYPKSIFFLGLFKGRYELNNNAILERGGGHAIRVHNRYKEADWLC